MENGGAKMEQCNDNLYVYLKTKKLDEIHKNSYEIRTNFVRIPQCLNMHPHSVT